MSSIGAVFSPYQHPPEDFRAAVQAAEAAGLSQLWLWEDCFRESAYASAAAALAWTENLRVGIGIAPLPLRNVAVTAMEVATIERMFPGRLMPGFGHGVLEWMGQAGARVKSPLTLMREQLPALRALLEGEEVTFSGRYVNLDRVRLDWPPDAAPAVYAAGEGPKTLALAGAVADGAILTGGYSSAEVADQIARVRAGAREADRENERKIVSYLTAAFGDGAESRVREALGERGIDDDRAAWGDPAEVAQVVRRLRDVGIDDVVLSPAAGEPDLGEFFRAAVEVERLIG